MKIRLITLCLVLTAQLQSQNLILGSWNIKDFGKSRDYQEIEMIAELLRDFDIVVIQEVVAKDPGGVKAIVRLVDALDRKGSNWDYIVSDPTSSSTGNISERYAFIWKKHKTKLLNRPRLLSEISSEVEREPYLATFQFKNNCIEILNYHACTHKKSYPERAEIKTISDWLIKHDSENIIWCGDMNLDISDQAFEKVLVSGFTNLFNGHRTSLKMNCNKGEFLSKSEDNVLYLLYNVKVLDKRIINFINPNNCEEVKWKRNSFSDHLPLQMILN